MIKKEHSEFIKIAEINNRMKKLLSSIKDCSKILLQKDKNGKEIKLK